MPPCSFGWQPGRCVAHARRETRCIAGVTCTGCGDSSALSTHPRRLKYAAFGIVLATLCGYRSVLPVFRDELEHSLSIGDAQFGLMFSISSLTAITTVLIGGWLVDRWGPGRVLRVCFFWE